MGFLRDCICVDTHLPRFEAIAYVLPYFDALTNVVIRVSSAFIFQTFLRSAICLRKGHIFQEFAEGLLSICVC